MLGRNYGVGYIPYVWVKSGLHEFDLMGTWSLIRCDQKDLRGM